MIPKVYKVYSWPCDGTIRETVASGAFTGQSMLSERKDWNITLKDHNKSAESWGIAVDRGKRQHEVCVGGTTTHAVEM